MPDCKSCGAWFAAVNKREDLCPTCEKALARLAGYAAPVVRCAGCRSYNKPRTGFCEIHLDREHPDDFCSYGKRKEGADHE